MHPELSKRLVLAQLDEAIRAPGLFSERLELEEVSYPLFFIRFINVRGDVRLLRFECEDYDFQAIEVEPVHPVTRQLLARDQWLLRDGAAFPSHHMKDGRPFFCITGTRDYYTHESHKPQVTGERWEARRPDFQIADLLKVIGDRFANGRWG